ncbi:hypothetical protein [Cupriavidus sp.]|uniref:hypothetical protein n=1 Tax=Cupriavidus sp. TaxID=1873897 RepID=UPI0028BEEB8A|nr:hypothetical protein [Cupriavidus sp.]
MERIETASPYERTIHYACVRFVRQVLWGDVAGTSDILQTITADLSKIAAHYAEYAIERRGDAGVIERAIAYMASIHDGPWRGKEWFDTTLAVLTELAIPNTGLENDGAAFLLDVRRGVSEAYEAAPLPKSELRITDDKAEGIKRFVAAAQEHGYVMDLLNIAERIFHGEHLSKGKRDLLHAAAVAAPMARLVRNDAPDDEHLDDN